MENNRCLSFQVVWILNNIVWSVVTYSIQSTIYGHQMSSCSSDCTALNCYFLPSLLHLVLVNYILWLSLVTPYSVYLCEVSESYCHTMCLSIYIYIHMHNRCYPHVAVLLWALDSLAWEAWAECISRMRFWLHADEITLRLVMGSFVFLGV